MFGSIIRELQTEEPSLFSREKIDCYREMIREGREQEIAWACAIGDEVPGLTKQMITDYIRYLETCVALIWDLSLSMTDMCMSLKRWPGQPVQQMQT